MKRLLLLAFLGILFNASAADLEPVKNAGPYVPSPQSVVSDMLRYADVRAGDFLIDLGSGDGRIVLTAAKVFGARGFGVEIKEDLVKRANEAARQEGVGDRVKFLKQDLFKTDISQATVVTMYLLPDTVNLLKDKFLSELRPGTRIVSHDYPLTGWIPEKYVQMDLEDKVQISGVTTTLIYLYVVPAKVEGRWKAQMPPAVSGQRHDRRPRCAARGSAPARRADQLPPRRPQGRVHRPGARPADRGPVRPRQRQQVGVERAPGRMKLVIESGKVCLAVDLKDTPTARAVFAAAPFEGRAQTWGDEVYFTTPVKAKLEPDAQQVVAPGTVCFWTQGDALALPFGRTPISTDDRPKLANPCNVLGSLADFSSLKNIKAGDKVRVEKA